MKATLLGALAGAGLILAAVSVLSQRNEVLAQRVTPGDQAGFGHDLIAMAAPAGEKSQLITVIDPRQHVMCVYHVDLATGKIALRSVRNIHWDLQMMYLNNESPLPLEIRSLLEPR